MKEGGASVNLSTCVFIAGCAISYLGNKKGAVRRLNDRQPHVLGGTCRNDSGRHEYEKALCVQV